MLNVCFNATEDVIYNTDVYFDNTYQSDWLEDEFADKVIRTVDKSRAVSGNAIDSPFLGVISPEKLSGGTKTLLLIFNCPGMIFNASTCGDNCVPFLLEISREKDVTVYLEHPMNFGTEPF